MRKVKKLTSAVVSLMMVCTSMGGFTFGTSAEMIISDDEIKINLNKTDNLSLSATKDGEPTVTYNGSTEICTHKKIVLTGTLENGFTIENGRHCIVLNGVTINDSVVINPNATANIKIEGTNTVTAKKVQKGSGNIGKAGINVPERATLNLSGNGTLTATGSDDGDLFGGVGSAGIGGNCKESAGYINICENVTVNAQGGNGGAGIGGGHFGNGGNINIYGGKVTAKGAIGGAGIGGGYYGNSGNINILGGEVRAEGEYLGAGIGSGIGIENCGNCENIIIKNSLVFSKAGYTKTCTAEPIGSGLTMNFVNNKTCYNCNYSGTIIINEKELNEETRKKNREKGYVQINRDGSTTEYNNGEIPNTLLYGPQLEKTNSNTTFDIQIHSPKNLDTNN